MLNDFGRTIKVFAVLITFVAGGSVILRTVLAEGGGADYRLFVRFADSPVEEVDWTPTEPRLIYTGPPSDRENRYRVIPCVVRMLDGTLVVLVHPGGNRPVFIRSTDGAKTWSKPYPGTLSEGVNRVSVLGVRRDGRLMAVSEKPLALIYSGDQGRTWTAGPLLDPSPMARAWVWTGGRPLELVDGTLVVPIAGYVGGSSQLSSAVLLSIDDGASWTFRILGLGNDDNKMIFSEPAVEELDDGSLVALLRTEDFVNEIVPGEPRGERTGLWRTNSTDGGKTWSSPIETLTGSHCSVARLPDGVLLCGYHRAPRLALSSDGGRTWYRNMLWSIDKPKSNWGWYASVAPVDDTTAIALMKDMKPYNTIRACLLQREPSAAGLARALTFFSSFDRSADADFALGDTRVHTHGKDGPVSGKPGVSRADVAIEKSSGRYGGALRFGKSVPDTLFYHGKQNIAYTATNWAGTVSFWMSLDPVKDLVPGQYCDPIQITDKKWDDASVWVDFDKDSPREFRLGVFADKAVWNPKGTKFSDIPHSERPMVPIKKSPFRSGEWTHVVFTFTRFNRDGTDGVATLYVNGRPSGTIEGRPQVFTWDPQQVLIRLGINYVGLVDDLAIFNRALTGDEVKFLNRLPHGIASLKKLR